MSLNAIASAASHITRHYAIAPLGERVARVTSQARGSPETAIVTSYVGRHSRRIIPALCLTVLLLNAVTVAAQSQYSPNSMALAHNVVVIGPSSPGFDTLLDKWFPGVTGVNYFQQLKPLLAIVHNNTRRAVKAYVVKWTITNADGSTSSAMLPVMWEPGPGEARLPGTVTVLGPAGTGLGTQLVSPYFHWPRRAFPGLLKINAVMISFQAANLKPTASSVQSATSVKTTLDGVIFGDGVFVGPDTSLLYERFQAAQQATVDEGAWMFTLLQSNPTVDEVKAQLSQQIYDGRNSTGTDAAGLYKSARGEQASELMSVLDQVGQTGLKNVASRLANANRMALQRQAGR